MVGYLVCEIWLKASGGGEASRLEEDHGNPALCM